MRNNSKYYLSFILLLSYSFCFAQENVIDSLKNILKTAKEDTNKSNILSLLVENINDEKVWSSYNQEAYELAQKLAESKNELIAKKGKTCLSDAINNIGYIYDNQGDIPNALYYYEKSLKIEEELGDKQGIAISLNNIGSIYIFQDNFPKALDYLERSLNLYEEVGDKHGIAKLLNNIGSMYTNKDASKAMGYFRRSLKISEETSDKSGIATSLDNIGGIYNNKNDMPEALVYYFRGLTIAEEIDDKMSIAYAFTHIGNAYLRQKKYPLALSYADSSLTLSKKTGFPVTIRNAESLFSRIEEATGNFAGAFEHYKQFIIYRDSIDNQATRKASIKSEFKYEYEKKEAVLKEQQEKERVVTKEKNRFQQIVIGAVMLGLLLVIVFAAFVVRSLRTARIQKTMIEEKQREILDSIHYAKRIQKSLLPTEKYIEKNLKRLMKSNL